MKRKPTMFAALGAAAIALSVGAVCLVRAVTHTKDSTVAFAQQFLTDVASGWEFKAARPYMTDQFAQSYPASEFEADLARHRGLGGFRSFDLMVWEHNATTAPRSGRTVHVTIKGYGNFENGRRRVLFELIDTGQGWRVDKFMVDPTSP